MILDASSKGWQIIYLSCKREVFDFLLRKEGIRFISMEEVLAGGSSHS